MRYIVIHTDTGEPYKAKKIRPYVYGTALEYNSPVHKPDVCYVPADYKWTYISNYAIAYKNINSDCAVEPSYYPPRDPDMGAIDLTALVALDIGFKGIEHLHKGLDWKWLILGAIAVVVVLAIVYLVKSQGG